MVCIEGVVVVNQLHVKGYPVLHDQLTKESLEMATLAPWRDNLIAPNDLKGF